MKFKDGIDASLAPEMSRVLPLIDKAHADASISRDGVLTSGRDSKHMKGSKHYVGMAVDIRTNDLTGPQISSLAENLRIRLNGNRKALKPYDIVVEIDHIHIEFDPK